MAQKNLYEEQTLSVYVLDLANAEPEDLPPNLQNKDDDAVAEVIANNVMGLCTTNQKCGVFDEFESMVKSGKLSPRAEKRIQIALEKLAIQRQKINEDAAKQQAKEASAGSVLADSE